MSADGSIKIAIEVDGKQVDVASKSLDNLETAGNDAGKGVGTAEDSLKDVGKESTKASGNIKKFATALGLVAIGAAAFQTLKASMDDAISRFDTLNQFPKVMQQVGFSAEESEAAINALSDGIEGLPTKLDDVTSTAQNIAVMTGDLEGAVDTTLALNNAFLASGANTADAERGLQQYVQMLSKGEVDLESWRSLQETMGAALGDVADAFGFAGKSAKNDLYAALKSGDITFNDFNAKLIELSNKTGGFADRAKTASEGIATSLANLRNAAARGIANIIESFNKLSRKVTGKNIAENINSLKGIVNASFTVIQGAIEATIPFFKAFGSVISATIPVVKTLSPALIGMATAFAIHAVINKTTNALKASKAVTIAVTAVKKLYTLAIKEATTAEVSHAAATKVLTAGKKALGVVTSAVSIIQGVFTGKIKLSTAAMLAKAAATKVLGTALKVLSGPVGWVTAGIGALAGAVIGIVKWFNKASAEEKKLAKDTNKLAESTKSLNEDISGNTEEHAKNVSEINASAKANSELAEKVQELADKENKSAEDKALLNSYVEKLNGSIDGLNLAYNEEADALNMSSEQLQSRVDLMKEQDALTESQERLVEITKDRNKAEEKLAEINENRDRWNKLLDEGGKKGKEAKEAIKELDEQEAGLNETLGTLKIQQKETEDQIVSSNNAITEAIKNGNAAQMISYEDLKGSVKEAFDSIKDNYETLKDTATDAFEKISTKSKVSMDKMQENLEHNQQAVKEWGENQSALMEWAAKNGHDNFMQWIQQLGPDHAGELKMLAENLKESGGKQGSELEKLAKTYEEGGKTATSALKKSMGKGFEEVSGLVTSMVDDTSTTLQDQIKAANFESIGINVGEGFGGGIEKSSKQAEKASKKMGHDTADSAKNALEVNSPSKVFKRLGSSVTEGLVLGINNGTSKVIQAVRKMFDSVLRSSNKSFKSITKGYDRSVKIIENSLKKLPEITQKSMKNMFNRLKSGANAQTRVMKILATKLVTSFNRTKGQLRSVGSNAMAGLNQGLRAGSGRVMSTARSIANRVASTMRNALRIHSPSRVMMEIGEFTGKGFVVGIASMQKEAKRTSEALAKATIPNSIMPSLASPRVKSNEKTKRNAEKILEIFSKLAEV